MTHPTDPPRAAGRETEPDWKRAWFAAVTAHNDALRERDVYLAALEWIESRGAVQPEYLRTRARQAIRDGLALRPDITPMVTITMEPNDLR